jgi:hypothetical protein
MIELTCDDEYDCPCCVEPPAMLDYVPIGYPAPDPLECMVIGVISSFLTADVYGGYSGSGGMPTGMIRSLNPLEEDEDDVVFEFLDEGLTADVIFGLWDTNGINGCPDSNVLWAIEEECEWCSDVIWFYEDTLATPVIQVSPSNTAKLTSNNEVTLEWEELCGADYYEVSLWCECLDCPGKEYVTISPECTDETCITVDGLKCGTTYYWKVRVCLGEPTLSKWSTIREFTTALAGVYSLCSPLCGKQDVILTPNFSWDAVSGATGYQIQLATNEDFSGAITAESIVNAWVYGEALENSTTYYWRVRPIKDGVYGSWTVCIFTTMAPPPEEPAPQEIVVKEVQPPEITVEVPPTVVLPAPTAPVWIWVIIAIGAVLVIVVIVLIVRTRRVM